MIGPSSAAGEKWRTIGSKWTVEEGIGEEAFPGLRGEWAGQLCESIDMETQEMASERTELGHCVRVLWERVDTTTEWADGQLKLTEWLEPCPCTGSDLESGHAQDSWSRGDGDRTAGKWAAE